MAIATTISDFLDDQGILYSVVKHPHTSSSQETAEAAHVPGDQLAKSVVLHDDKGYVMAVIPSTHKVEVSIVGQLMSRELDMAHEEEFEKLFKDCEVGAVPAIGRPYGVEVVWNDSLAEQSDIFFESGDHEILVRVDGNEFKKLMQDEPHGYISKHI